MSARTSNRVFMSVSHPETGFVLPVILGVGMIMMLLGVMMVERAHQNRLAATAQKFNDQSLSVAEHGITQLQVLLNRYRALTTVCSHTTLSPFCRSTVPWSTLSNATLDPCNPSTTEAIAMVQDYASQRWRNVGTTPEGGQFRLINYQYQPNENNTQPLGGGVGTLIVEGRVNPGDASRTATTRLKVMFNVTRELGLGSPPGLWIRQNQIAENTNDVQFLAQVRDSTCPGDPASLTPVQQFQRQTQTPFTYQAMPGMPFPELTPEGISPPATRDPSTRSIAAITKSGSFLPLSTQATSEAGTTGSGKVFSYYVQAQNGQSINLSNPSDILKLGTGSDTLILNLAGGLTITGGGSIRLAPGSTLIIYAHGPVSLTSSGSTPAIEQEGAPSSARVQIYVYPSPLPTPAPSVSLNGNEVLLYLTLVAPESIVLSSAQVQGSIWAKSWQGRGAAVVRQDPLQANDLKLLWAPRISPITVWQRQENS